MSNRRFDKNSTSAGNNSDEKFSWTPVFLSDSKGKYLKTVSHDSRIVWICKSGFTSSDIFSWLHRNLQRLLKRHNYISVYVWVGTCDFSAKGRHYISLREKQCDVLQRLCDNLHGIQEICAKSSRIKVTFLQIPYYSIQRWNGFKGHHHTESFKSDDHYLTDQIDYANDFIKTLNDSVHTYTPQLNHDLIRSRKKKGRKQRYSWNFNLYKDGIHPDKKLANSWLNSISKKIRKDCL